MFCSTVIATIGRPSLHRAVNSVLKQQFFAENFEIIVVNDSGKPLAQASWQRDEKVKIINTHQRERSVARNAGAALAKGYYIHFLDDDDWMLPDAFENLWQLSQRAPDAAWLYGGCQLVDRQRKPLIKYQPTLSGNIFTQVMAGEWIPCLASLIKSDAFFAVGGFHPNIVAGEDIDLCRRIALYGDFAQTSHIIAYAGIGTESNSTDSSNPGANNLLGREEILQMPGIFKRMCASANSGYWYGRIIRVYLTSVLWNFQHRKLLGAASRILFGLVAYTLAGTHVLFPELWRAVAHTHQGETFARALQSPRDNQEHADKYAHHPSIHHENILIKGFEDFKDVGFGLRGRFKAMSGIINKFKVQLFTSSQCLSPPPLISIIPKLKHTTFIAVATLSLTFAFDWKRPLIQLAGVSVTSLEILLALTISLWLMTRISITICQSLSDQTTPPAYQSGVPYKLMIPIVVWTGTLLTSTFFATPHLIDALKLSFKIVGSITIGWAVFELSYTKARWQFIAQLLTLCGVGVALLGLIEATEFPPFTVWLAGFQYGTKQFIDISRISSTLEHPNFLAMVLELTLPLVLAWIFTARRIWIRGLLGVGLLVGLIALMLTLSRGGLIAFVLSFGLIIVVSGWYRHKPTFYGGLMTIVTLLFLIGLQLIINPLLLVRFVSEGSDELWYRAEYKVPEHLTVSPGTTLTIPVTLTNTGLQKWKVEGAKPFNLAYHLVWLENIAQSNNIKSLDSTQKNYAIYEGVRTFLPNRVQPNASVNVIAQVKAPSEPGEYVIEWDMIQESVTWFSNKGVAPGVTRLTVLGTPSNNRVWQNTAPVEDKSPERPSRYKLWLTAWNMVSERPLLGVGPSNYRWNYSVYTDENQQPPYHAHSLYFGWLAETGVIGLLAFLWVSWRLMKIAWQGRGLKHDNNRFWIWWLALMAGLTSWFIHGLVDFPYASLSLSVAFWIIAGLAIRAAVFAEETKRA